MHALVDFSPAHTAPRHMESDVTAFTFFVVYLLEDNQQEVLPLPESLENDLHVNDTRKLSQFLSNIFSLRAFQPHLLI